MSPCSFLSLLLLLRCFSNPGCSNRTFNPPTLPQAETAPRLITAASPDSPLTRELDRHQSVSCQSGGSLIGLEYLVEIKEVGQTIIPNAKAFI